MSSGFVSETELAEARKVRQEEWEKVRTADQPLERPEEPYDPRSLYEQLKEQKDKKDMEFEESHKLKNLIRGLEDDEVQFLDLIDQNKLEAEKRQQIEDAKELREFRERVATLHEKSMENKLQSEISKPKTKSVSNTRPSQKSLLGGGVLRKRPNTDEKSQTDEKMSKDNNGDCVAVGANNSNRNPPVILNVKENSLDDGVLKCVAILPGIGKYQDSSDSEISSDSEEEVLQSKKFDLVGREIEIQKVCEKNRSE